MSDRKLTVSDRRLAALEQFERAQVVGGGDWKTIAAMLAAAVPRPRAGSEDPAVLAQWADYRPAPDSRWHWRYVEVRFSAGRVVAAAKCLRGHPINWGYAVRSAAAKLLMRLSEDVARSPGGGMAHTFTQEDGSTATDWDGLAAAESRIAKTIDLGEVLSMRCDGIECEVLPEIAPRRPMPDAKAKRSRR